MRNSINRLSCLVLVTVFSQTYAQQNYQPTPENLKSREWFQDAKFGLFIHWGVYSVLGDGEWVMNNEHIPIKAYEKIPNFFNPTQFDAAEWVRMVKDAGMKALLSNKVTLGGDASASAGPVGRHVSAETDIKADTGILTYSRSKGLFAGLTLKGAVMRQDDDSTKAVYGLSGEQAYKRILTGQVPPPPEARQFLATVRSAVSGSLAERQEIKKEAAKDEKKKK